MSLANLKVFNEYTYAFLQEKIAQEIALFNTATNGGLVLRSAKHQGDYSDEASYKRIAGLVRRRDAYGAGAVGAVDINMLLKTSVKIAAGTPPVNVDPGWWDWIARNPEEAAVLFAQQLAEDTLADMVNTAIKAIVAALTNVGATVVYDGTAGKATLNALNSGAALFGDRAGDIKVWLMHSKPLFDIYDAALTNANVLFSFGTVKVVQDGLGRPFVVSDAPDLAYTSSGAKYHTIGLSSNAAVVEQNPDYHQNIDERNGFENITRTLQAQWSYNLGLKGFAWDKDNGGHSPTNSAIGTGTNWDQVAANIKDISGVLVNSQ